MKERITLIASTFHNDPPLSIYSSNSIFLAIFGLSHTLYSTLRFLDSLNNELVSSRFKDSLFICGLKKQSQV